MEGNFVTKDGKKVEIVYNIKNNICFRYNGKGKSFVMPIDRINEKIDSGEWVKE